MKTRHEITQQLTLMADTDTFNEALAFVMDAVEELGEEVEINIDHRILPGEEGERQLYYKVRVRGTSERPRKEGVTS